jgi:ATP-dependent protease Clp ATPase subunit
MIDLACSFCAKRQREVFSLLGAGETMICDECVQRCVEIIARDPTRPGTREWVAQLKRRIARSEFEPAPHPQNLISIGATAARI